MANVQEEENLRNTLSLNCTAVCRYAFEEIEDGRYLQCQRNYQLNINVDR